MKEHTEFQSIIDLVAERIRINLGHYYLYSAILIITGSFVAVKTIFFLNPAARESNHRLAASIIIVG